MTKNSAYDLNTTLAATHGWIQTADGKFCKNHHVIDIDYTDAGNIKYAAMFYVNVDADEAYQIDLIDNRTQAKRARVAGWLTYSAR